MKRRLMQRRVQLGFLAVFVVLALIVGSIVLNPASTKDELSIVQSAITSVAIFVGGAFAVFKLQIFRDFEPHLTISQKVSHRFIGNNYVHIAVTSTLNNSSKVRVEVRKDLFRLQRILPVSDAEVEYLRDQVFEHQAFEDIQWPKCYELTRTWQKNQFIVEPGESLHPRCSNCGRLAWVHRL